MTRGVNHVAYMQGQCAALVVLEVRYIHGYSTLLTLEYTSIFEQTLSISHTKRTMLSDVASAKCAHITTMIYN